MYIRIKAEDVEIEVGGFGISEIDSVIDQTVKAVSNSIPAIKDLAKKFESLEEDPKKDEEENPPYPLYTCTNLRHHC